MPRRKAPVTFEILRLRAQSMSTSAIAKTVGCSAQHVAMTLRRNKLTNNGFYALLPGEHFAWLQAEAERNGVRVQDMARALLIDAIEEAKG